jgi:hypothetical protein
MQASEKFLAVQTALAGISDEELGGLDGTAMASRLGAAAKELSPAFLENAKAVILRGRADARRRGRIESVLPTIRAIWPAADLEDCDERLVVWLQGKPAAAAEAAKLPR